MERGPHRWPAGPPLGAVLIAALVLIACQAAAFTTSVDVVNRYVSHLGQGASPRRAGCWGARRRPVPSPSCSNAAPSASAETPRSGQLRSRRPAPRSITPV